VEILRSNTLGAALLPLALDKPQECTAENRCLARCVVNTRCETISFVVAGTSIDPNESVPEGAGAFRQCLHRCLGRD
jgi:hypothetical protein